MLEVDRDGRASHVPDYWLRLLYVQVVSRSQSSITCSGGIIHTGSHYGVLGAAAIAAIAAVAAAWHELQPPLPYYVAVPSSPRPLQSPGHGRSLPRLLLVGTPALRLQPSWSASENTDEPSTESTTKCTDRGSRGCQKWNAYEFPSHTYSHTP